MFDDLRGIDAVNGDGSVESSSLLRVSLLVARMRDGLALGRRRGHRGTDVVKLA